MYYNTNKFVYFSIYSILCTPGEIRACTRGQMKCDGETQLLVCVKGHWVTSFCNPIYICIDRENEQGRCVPRR
ncbi:hypothetical protein AX774_g6516, partial [Zancudomyces culisetae]